MPDPNVTMVAFHGMEKPEALRSLIADITEEIHRQLGPLSKVAFTKYLSPQIHATIIGMEVDREDGVLINRWFKRNRGGLRRPIATRVLQEVVRSFVHDGHLFTIRFGGFQPAHCRCESDRLGSDGWRCYSSLAELHSCDRTPYEGSFYAAADGPVVMTGWPVAGPHSLNVFTHELYAFRQAAEAAGVLDKYHSDQKPHWKDDDFFIRLGTFSSSDSNQISAIEECVRELLSDRTPISINVRVQDVSIVLYEDASLQEDVVRARVPLAAFLEDHWAADFLYEHF